MHGRLQGTHRTQECRQAPTDARLLHPGSPRHHLPACPFAPRQVRVGNPAKVRPELRGACLDALMEGTAQGQQAARYRAEADRQVQRGRELQQQVRDLEARMQQRQPQLAQLQRAVETRRTAAKAAAQRAQQQPLPPPGRPAPAARQPLPGAAQQQRPPAARQGAPASLEELQRARQQSAARAQQRVRQQAGGPPPSSEAQHALERLRQATAELAQAEAAQRRDAEQHRQAVQAQRESQATASKLLKAAEDALAGTVLTVLKSAQVGLGRACGLACRRQRCWTVLNTMLHAAAPPALNPSRRPRSAGDCDHVQRRGGGAPGRPAVPRGHPG